MWCNRAGKAQKSVVFISHRAHQRRAEYMYGKLLFVLASWKQPAEQNAKPESDIARLNVPGTLYFTWNLLKNNKSIIHI